MNVREIIESKDQRKLSMVSAYSYFEAKFAEQAGVDLILVGDSLGTMVMGKRDTLSVTMDEMIWSLKSARRGSKQGFIVADMPFGSYQCSREKAVENVIAFLRHGANAVKIEGGYETADLIKYLVDRGLPVMGHIGITPEHASLDGEYHIQGRDERSIKRLIESVNDLEEAGVFAILLEMVVEDVAKRLTEDTSVPTFGLGSGRYCNGQFLRLHDLLGINDESKPKYIKRYANLKTDIIAALSRFDEEVKSGMFPDEENAFEGVEEV
ncbi:3-methyl-2-oxobutanoate hydroxymethyltransferase [Mesotoga sp. Brook.08.YT.4.2.5.1]|jgi:3-methyl-2-oxobutanoate hydroxymethyltransferase|uniref:3-methyl-2-oxobutanoate hydroxymethyltransferase n=1 Tax=Mesotoga prima TaxID=1184387 RepID=A0A124FYV9_9BACT|nr:MULTISPECIES: 3-methyl-2-oxobutanoate hydroxymethyltransferase [unclassified Mesotoga]KUK82407.1 MAG: 3-methyl-2-oxobutanoate hydroxymethyltransferase [Mesotoga prima]PXF35536.1 3-methyl-2-oxobutanoate hydroxymethyltransferase [Mesotoga sp. SC_NapDC]RAM63898.1 3-methyl-2-oxobutanoate hydroxymethyltransferase [Mesotoga sp. SC_3PWM13N19]PNE22659.1 3-methyl-2-oxobutanoate hydroxymethyltransferase [Mesotoga sp. Brook.08.YT.4.2.5.1]PNS42577.1 3-methyl-2-oxobutanoate hydroxymethyltransferase [Mes